MMSPIRVTFDHNTYEFVVEPTKNGVTEKDKGIYSNIRELIEIGKIIPYISETVLTLETLRKKDRQRILGNEKRLVISQIPVKNDAVGISYDFRIGPNENLYPNETDLFYKYLPKAIELGFKVLPNFRLGKIKNPNVKPEWFHRIKTADPLEIPNKFGKITDEIEREGLGFARLQEVVNYSSDQEISWIEAIKKYQGDEKKFSEGVAEYSDGDSIAIHIAYGLKYFCTLDGSGKREKTNSVLGHKMKKQLELNYGIEFITPLELVKLFEKI